MDVEKKNLYVNNCYVKKPTLFTMLAPHCNTMRRPPTHAVGAVSRPKRCKHVVANGGFPDNVQWRKSSARGKTDY